MVSTSQFDLDPCVSSSGLASVGHYPNFMVWFDFVASKVCSRRITVVLYGTCYSCLRAYCFFFC